ncbi:hypothetical protein [Roseateles albus]|uniref:Solute-binding protein family 3/N-terminal domain-containing protein n=1 Tax=Roseateles albus TaxID=2987525 RepID=A0ABT5KGQ1_9BURK|nr:hypothetical protein [Roseateles albus]MDC8773035.1 hypothetical protein [Roseateles albus]
MSWASERVLLRAGTPEGLPGYDISGGKLIIKDSSKRRIFECIESALNARFEWQALPTKRLIQMIMDGQLDIAFPMGFATERASVMLQSAATWDNPDVWLSLRPVNIQDKNLRIAARLGSPQQIDHLADGYTHVTGSYTYPLLAKELSMDVTTAVIVPQSVYEEQKAHWPSQTLVTVGRQRSSGFYLKSSDPLKLLKPLNLAIEACRVSDK